MAKVLLSPNGDSNVATEVLKSGGGVVVLQPGDGGGGGGGEPIHYEFWVGQLDTPPATPTGAIGAPFPTLTEAVAAGAALGGEAVVTLLLCDGDYTAEADITLATGIAWELVNTTGLYSLIPNVELVCDTGEEGGSTGLILRNVALETLSLTGETGGRGVVVVEMRELVPFLGVVNINASELAAGDVDLRLTNAYVEDIDGDGRIVLIQSNNSTITGTVAADAAVLTTFGGWWRAHQVSVFQFEGIVGTIWGVDSEVTQEIEVGAVPAREGFTACQFNGAVQWTGPSGSFRSDIDSSLSFFRQAGSLIAPATTWFAPSAGKVPQVNSDGFIELASLNGYGSYATRPAPGRLGNRYVASDGAVEWVDDGTVWRPLIAGRPGTQIPLLASFLAPVGVATFSDVAGTIGVLSTGTGTDNLSALKVAKPAGGSIFTAHLSFHEAVNGTNNGGGAGIVVSNGTAYRFIGVVLGTGNPPFLVTETWTNINTPAGFGNAGVPGCSSGLWVRIRDGNAGTIFFEASADGVSWAPYGSVASAGFTQYGIAVRDNAPTIAVFDSFSIV